jgi:hypothetical protein
MLLTVCLTNIFDMQMFSESKTEKPVAAACQSVLIKGFLLPLTLHVS